MPQGNVLGIEQVHKLEAAMPIRLVASNRVQSGIGKTKFILNYCVSHPTSKDDDA